LIFVYFLADFKGLLQSIVVLVMQVKIGWSLLLLNEPLELIASVVFCGVAIRVAIAEPRSVKNCTTQPEVRKIVLFTFWAIENVPEFDVQVHQVVFVHMQHALLQLFFYLLYVNCVGLF